MTNAVVKITDYEEFRGKIAEVEEVCNFLPNVTTDEGYEKSKRVALDVGKILTALEKKRVDLKADSLAYGKLIDSQAKAIKNELSEFMLPHKEAYKELDNLQKRREQDRKDALEARIDEMRQLPELMADSDSDGVKMALESISSDECLDMYEYTMEALKVKKSVTEKLTTLFAGKLEAEKNAAELERLQKVQAERDQKDHEDSIAKIAADNARKEIEMKAEAEEEAKLAREQDVAHQAKINNEAVDSLVSRGLSEIAAKEVVTLIAQRKVKNVTINY